MTMLSMETGGKPPITPYSKDGVYTSWLVEKTVEHGFTPTTVLTVSNGDYVKALASKDYMPLFVVKEVVSKLSFVVATSGFIPVTGLTDDTVYFLSPTIPGTLTTVKPASFIYPVLMASKNIGYLLLNRS